MDTRFTAFSSVERDHKLSVTWRERGRERQRETDRRRQRETETDIHTDRLTDRDRQTETERDRQTERQTERQTSRQRDREKKLCRRDSVCERTKEEIGTKEAEKYFNFENGA